METTPKEERRKNQISTTDLNIIEAHKAAARHHEEAANHHIDAWKYHEIGHTEKASESTILALGHSQLATEALNKLAKSKAFND